MRLEPLELWLERDPGPLRPQILAALRQHGEPLRWAITAVEPSCSATPAIDGSWNPSQALSPEPLLIGDTSGARAGCDVAFVDTAGFAQCDQKGDGSGRLRLEAVMLR